MVQSAFRKSISSMGDDDDAGLDGQLVSFLYISSLCSRIPIDTKIALILEEFPKIPSPTPFHKQRIYNLILDLLGLIPKNIGTCSKLLDVIWSDKNHAIKFLEQAKISHLFEFYTTIEAREILEHLIVLYMFWTPAHPTVPGRQDQSYLYNLGKLKLLFMMAHYTYLVDGIRLMCTH